MLLTRPPWDFARPIHTIDDRCAISSPLLVRRAPADRTTTTTTTTEIRVKGERRAQTDVHVIRPRSTSWETARQNTPRRARTPPHRLDGGPVQSFPLPPHTVVRGRRGYLPFPTIVVVPVCVRLFAGYLPFFFSAAAVRMIMEFVVVGGGGPVRRERFKLTRISCRRCF